MNFRRKSFQKVDSITTEIIDHIANGVIIPIDQRSKIEILTNEMIDFIEGDLTTDLIR